jgi:cytoskeletal protein RodZ
MLIFAFTFVIFQLAPTLANELTPSPNNEVMTPPTSESSTQPSASPEPQGTSTPTPVPVPTEESTAPVPTSSPTPSPSTSASPPPITALANQSMQLRVPTSLLVDPRARTASISELFVSGPQNLLVCITSGSLVSDVYLKNFSDSDFGAQTLVAGDRTSNLKVTGSADQVLAILNSAQGVRVSSPTATIATHNLNFRFVATSAPTLDAKLCEKGSPANSRTLSFRELGLEIEMKKGDVILKR